MPTVEENERVFESMGLARVKALLGVPNALPQDQVRDAAQWVAKRSEEERQERIAFETEQGEAVRNQLEIAIDQQRAARLQLKVARDTLKAAWIAAALSFGALVVTVLAWVFPLK
jgi:hypothetical protein